MISTLDFNKIYTPFVLNTGDMNQVQQRGVVVADCSAGIIVNPIKEER